MACRESIITPENLKSNIYKNAFENDAHKFYVVYDNFMDELMVRLNKPEDVVVKFPISDTLSLLVDPVSFEVMGVQLSEFTKEFLPQFHDLHKSWYSKNMAECFSKYQELNYDPKTLGGHMHRKQAEENYYFVPYNKIDSVLATC